MTHSLYHPIRPYIEQLALVHIRSVFFPMDPQCVGQKIQLVGITYLFISLFCKCRLVQWHCRSPENSVFSPLRRWNPTVFQPPARPDALLDLPHVLRQPEIAEDRLNTWHPSGTGIQFPLWHHKWRMTSTMDSNTQFLKSRVSRRRNGWTFAVFWAVHFQASDTLLEKPQWSEIFP